MSAREGSLPENDDAQARGRGPAELRPSLLIAGLIALVAALWIACLALSDNIHSLTESTAYDRLVLAQRTFWVHDHSLPWPRWDPNFPLGTAVLFALPQLVGLDPVLFGRLHSLLWACAAALTLAALVRRSLPQLPAALVVLVLAGVPAFVRGAVVSGEEATATALLLLGLLGLLAGIEDDSEAAVVARRRSRAWLVASVLAVSGTVLFRLDLMLAVPGFMLAGIWLLRGRAGLAYAAGCCSSTLLHLALAWHVQGGSPLAFVRAAHTTTARSADGFAGDGGAFAMVGTLAPQLGGPWLGWLALILVFGAAAALLRGSQSRPARLLAIAWLWLLVAYQSAALAGILEVRSARYLVPLLALSCPLLVHGAALLAGRLGARPARAIVALLAALMFCLGGITALGEARSARLPDGLLDCSLWLGEKAEDGRVLVAERHPVVVLHSGLPYEQTDVLPGSGPQALNAGQLIQALQERRARWLLAFPGQPPSAVLSDPAVGLETRKQCSRLQVLEWTGGSSHSPR